MRVRCRPLWVGLCLFVPSAGAAVVLPSAAPATASRAPAPDVHAPGAWWTFARGDEVLAAAIDPLSGNVWLGTEGGGVVVWDATARTFQQHAAPNQPGLLSNTVYDVAFDPSSGDAWLATADGLTHVARSTGWWTTYVHPSHLGRTPNPEVVAVAGGLPPFHIWSAVTVGQDGTLWAGIPQAERALDTGDARTVASMAPDGGVVRRTPDGRWQWFPFHPQRTDGPARSTVADLAALPDGRLAIAHGRRGNPDIALSIYDPATDRWSAIRSVGPIGDVAGGPRTGQVMQLAVTSEAQGDFSLWLATWSRGVYRWRSGRWTAYSRADSATGITTTAGLCGDQVWAIAAAPDAVWAACVAKSAEDGLGVSRFDRVTGDWRTIGVADGLPTGIVTAIAAVEGRAFLGTDEPTVRHTGGIGVVPVRATATEQTVEPALSTATDGRTPAANEITALTFDPAGRLWVGTRGAGLLGWDPQDGRWRQWTTASTVGALAGDAVADVLVRGDDLWVASTRSRGTAPGQTDGGLTVIDRATGHVGRTLRPSSGGLPGGLPGGQPSSLANGPDGRLYVGFGAATGGVGIDVHHGTGVAAFDPEGDQWTVWRRSDGRLGGDTVLDLAVGPTAVWAAVSYAPDGTRDVRLTGGGVGALDENDWRFWRTGDFGLVGYQDGAITGDVRTVAVAADGAVWAGTFGLDGEITGRWPLVDAVANRYDPVRRGWQAVSFAGDGWVSAIADDADGRVWLGTTRGHTFEIWRADEVRGDRDVVVDRRDPADGGIWLGTRIEGPWVRLAPDNSGLPSRAITALTVEPATGHIWVGTAGGGLAVFTGGAPYGPTDPGRRLGRDRGRLTFRAWLPVASR